MPLHSLNGFKFLGFFLSRRSSYLWRVFTSIALAVSYWPRK